MTINLAILIILCVILIMLITIFILGCDLFKCLKDNLKQSDIHSQRMYKVYVAMKMFMWKAYNVNIDDYTMEDLKTINKSLNEEREELSNERNSETSEKERRTT